MIDDLRVACYSTADIATNPVANPSRPSVKFTAFDVAVIVYMTRGIYMYFISNIPFAINGNEIFHILIGIRLKSLSIT